MKRTIILLFAFISFSAFAQKIEVENPNQLTISPNPCEAFTRINFTLEKLDTIDLQIFNMMGASIHSFFKEEILPKGNYEIYYNTDSLKTGVYLVSLKITAHKYASKLIKVNTITALSKLSGTKVVQVFPNPLHNNLTIDYAGQKEIEISNLEGKIVLQMKTTSTDINLFSLPDATYVLQVWNEANEIIVSQKIVKGE